MQVVGIRELKNRLTHYLRLTRGGAQIVVTDRGRPIAIIHSLDDLEPNAGAEERLAALASRGLVRLPERIGGLEPRRAIQTVGRPASDIIIEERR